MGVPLILVFLLPRGGLLAGGEDPYRGGGVVVGKVGSRNGAAVAVPHLGVVR